MSDRSDAPPPPWKKKTPRKSKGSVKLSEESRRMAMARALEHGRRYPNLIDNMWAAQQQSARARKPRKGR
jgi:hypothetical protein